MDQHNREQGKSGSSGAMGTSSPGMSEYSAGNVNRDYGTTRTGTTGTGEDAMARTKEKTQQAKDTAAEMTGQATERAKGMMEEQKSRAVHTLSGVAGALRETGHQLESHDQEQFGQYAEKIADQIDRFSMTLRERSVEDLLYEAESFARREPQLFLGGAVALGLLAARFFKSSSARARRYDYGDYDQGRYYRSTYTGYTTPAGSYGTQGYRGQGYSGSGYAGGASSTDVDQPGTTGTDRPADYNPTDYR